MISLLLADVGTAEGAFLLLLVWAGVAAAVVAYSVNKANKAELKKNSESLAAAVQLLDANPSDRDVQLQFLSKVTGLQLPHDKPRIDLDRALAILKGNLGDTQVQQAFMRYLICVQWKEKQLFDAVESSYINRAVAYKSILNMLAINSEPSVKQFVLDVARWHYALDRTGGKLTIYDEQAIQNDILMHSKT